MKVYAFDVDNTLSLFNGPVPEEELLKLQDEGHIVGICGNWPALFRRMPAWKDAVRFAQPDPLISPKDECLRKIAQAVPAAEEYVMVGNDLGGLSDDKGAAERARWRFIKESDFAAGVR